MFAQSISGSKIELTPEMVHALRTGLRGPLLLPGDSGYDEARTLWNAMIDRRPALVARPLGTADVIECVRFARQQDLLLSIKGGGHNIAGLAAAEGALMLDMSLMRGVWVEPQRKIAHAQAGCLLGDVDRETQLHGLATVLGFVSIRRRVIANARYVVNISSAWERAEEDEINMAWARNCWNEAKRFSTGGNYINFLTQDETPERVEAALGSALQRLAQVKAKWDSHNVFRTNRNIQPG